MSLTIKEVLRDNNLSVTKQRLLVFNVLGKHHEPISIKQLHDLTKESVDRVSLYRIVEVFENANIIKRVQIGWKYKLELSDQFHAHHHREQILAPYIYMCQLPLSWFCSSLLFF